MSNNHELPSNTKANRYRCAGYPLTKDKQPANHCQQSRLSEFVNERAMSLSGFQAAPCSLPYSSNALLTYRRSHEAVFTTIDSDSFAFTATRPDQSNGGVVKEDKFWFGHRHHRASCWKSVCARPGVRRSEKRPTAPRRAFSEKYHGNKP